MRAPEHVRRPVAVETPPGEPIAWWKETLALYHMLANPEPPFGSVSHPIRSERPW